MPTVMDDRMKPGVFKEAELVPPFSFTKGAKVLKIHDDSSKKLPPMPYDLLFDLQTDPAQTVNLIDYPLRSALCKKMIVAMKNSDAPKEAYARYALDGDISAKGLQKQEEERCKFKNKGIYAAYDFEDSAKEFIFTVLKFIPSAAQPIISLGLRKHLGKFKGKKITCEDVDGYFQSLKGMMRPLANASHMVMAYFLHK